MNHKEEKNMEQRKHNKKNIQASPTSKKLEIQNQSKEQVAWDIFGSEIGEVYADFMCTLENGFHLNGCLYITCSHTCFFSNFFGAENKWKIGYSSIQSVMKALAPFWEPTVVVVTAERQYVFRGFKDRDTVYEVIWCQLRAWRQKTHTENWHLLLLNPQNMETQKSDENKHVLKEQSASCKLNPPLGARSRTASVLSQVALGELPINPSPTNNLDKSGAAGFFSSAVQTPQKAFPNLSINTEQRPLRRGIKTEGSRLHVIDDQLEQKSKERKSVRHSASSSSTVEETQHASQPGHQHSRWPHERFPESFEDALELTKLKHRIVLELDSDSNRKQELRKNVRKKKTELWSFPVPFSEFFNLVLSDSALFGLPAYHLHLGDWELGLSPWCWENPSCNTSDNTPTHLSDQDSDQKGKQAPLLKRKLRYWCGLQWIFGLHRSNVVEEHKCWLYGRQGIIFQISRTFGEIPAKDSFSIQERWVIRPGGSPSKSCLVSGDVEVTFSEYVLWGPWIEHKAREEAHDFHKGFLSWTGDFIERPITTPPRSSSKKIVQQKDLGKHEMNAGASRSSVSEDQGFRSSRFFIALPYIVMCFIWLLQPKRPANISLVQRLDTTYDHFKIEDFEYIQIETPMRRMRELVADLQLEAAELRTSLKQQTELEALELLDLYNTWKELVQQVSFLNEDISALSAELMNA